MTSKKKKKLRVAFRKNRQKKARSRKPVLQILDDVESGDVEPEERLSGKGELTRYRTIIATEDGQGGSLRAVDESKCLTGRVVSAIGLNSLVETADGSHYECTTRRVVRTMARDERNAVVTGDEVLFLPADDKKGVIERVSPRRGTISRATRRREHLIVANVDQALIVVSADEPPLKPNLVDRFLVSAEKGEIDSIVCINKVDLVDPSSLQPIVGVYSRLGYHVVLTSAMNQTGLGRLRALLRNRETVLTGQSGVGKSSLLNALDPQLKLRTGEVSDWTKKGRHTTRRAILLKLADGGWVVDTPGMRQFQLWDVLPEEMEAFFIEFRPFVTLCRFPDCSHTHETGCSVKQAVQTDRISRQRYQSYLRIITSDSG